MHCKYEEQLCKPDLIAQGPKAAVQHRDSCRHAIIVHTRHQQPRAVVVIQYKLAMQGRRQLGDITTGTDVPQVLSIDTHILASNVVLAFGCGVQVDPSQ